MRVAGRPRVAISRPGLPGAPMDLLGSQCDVAVWDGAVPPTRAQLGELMRDCDGAIVLGVDRIDAALLEAAGPRLKVVALSSMGYDAVDVAAAEAAGVVVTHTPGILAETTADVAMALILMARRRLGAAVDAMRRGEWRAFAMDGFLGMDVHGATLGILGYGQIGEALARRALGFGMRVQHHSRSGGDQEHSRWVGFSELLQTSDVVSVHVPLSPETAGLIGAAELELMKPTATLVNTARGGIVDETALMAALRAGRLHSAGLDVMVDEPRNDPDDPLFSTPNLVVLPHVGSATEATRAAMVELAARNVRAVLDGNEALTPLPGTASRPVVSRFSAT